ncbi:MAG: polyprenyl synthetase family protein [Thermoflexales bacterium]|nr:polyprenyl synthetase family protein [Thermoflexales bacterium]
MDISQILEPIRQDLALVEARLRQPPPREYDLLTAATQHLLSSGGKRIRPALAILANRLYTDNSEKIIALAAAVEMLHTATLVHDDVVDNAFLRRGAPTLNAQWTPAATILTGDYLFARAAELAAQTDNAHVLDIFARTLMTICSGELRQHFRKNQPVYTWQDYYERIEAKTAALFSCTAEASGVLAGAAENEVQALHDYGHNLGIAFQIVDDVLDFESDKTTLGKPVGSDLAQGLVTLPVLYYLEQQPHDNPVGDLLNQAEQQRSPQAIAQAVEAIRQSNAIRLSLVKAGDFVKHSQEKLKALPDRPARQTLHDLAQFAIQRQL